MSNKILSQMDILSTKNDDFLQNGTSSIIFVWVASPSREICDEKSSHLDGVQYLQVACMTFLKHLTPKRNSEKE